MKREPVSLYPNGWKIRPHRRWCRWVWPSYEWFARPGANNIVRGRILGRNRAIRMAIDVARSTR